MSKVRKGIKPSIKSNINSQQTKRKKFIKEIRENKQLFDNIYNIFGNKFSKKIYHKYFNNCLKTWTQIRAIVNGKLWREAYNIVNKENIW